MPVLQVNWLRTHQEHCCYYILYLHAVQGIPVTPIYPDAFSLFDVKKLTL